MAKRRRALGENAILIESIARDAEREGRADRAAEIRAQRPEYRKIAAQKKLIGAKKARKYKNLAVFNKECSTQGNGKDAMICDLTNIKRLSDGSAMATVEVMPLYNRNNSRAGRWLLHFRDPTILENHLRERVRTGTDAWAKFVAANRRR